MLDAFLPGDRRRALAGESLLADPAHGAVLFADISGFTPLTESLARDLGPHRGSEELTLLLDRVFAGLIGTLQGYGGSVIYFSGDAITCWLDGDDGVRAVACALAMQRCMADFGEVVTPAGRRAPLAAKIAVAAGSARRFVVGDPSIQRLDVLAGRVVDHVAAAERLANPGEVLADESVLDRIEGLKVSAWRTDPSSGRTFGVVVALGADVPPANARPARPPLLDPEVLRPWILPALYDRLQAQHGAFVAEFRPVCSLFLDFGSIDADAEPAACEKLDGFIREVQRILASFGGHLLQITLGDKGGYLYAMFGAPLAHEDDVARACMAALRLREMVAPDGHSPVRLGLTHGRLYSGTYGHPQRRAFACMGDPVNLAARLMTCAAPTAIYASTEVRDAAGPAFTFEPLPPLRVRGKTDPVAAVRLTGSTRNAPRRAASGPAPMIGRRRELDALAVAWQEAAAGNGGVVGVSAEAGMGKSRLIEAFIQAACAGASVASGACERFGIRASYFVWRDVWRKLLEVDGQASLDDQVAALRARVARIEPALATRVPLLGALLDLPIAESPLTAAFDAKLRKASLEDLLVTCLQGIAREHPLVIVLEDCHWIDELSSDLLQILGRVVPQLPVLIVASWRPQAAGAGIAVASWPRFVELALPDLPIEEAHALVMARLQPLLARDTEPSPALVTLIAERAQGNPFYIGELVSFLAARGIDLSAAREWSTLELPDSLHSLVLSRIDAFTEGPRRTLKVASVIGRVFEAPALPQVFPSLGSGEEVHRQLALLCGAGLVAEESAEEETYLFRHAITQEVAYESLPFALRSLLHGRVGHYLEQAGPEAIERNLDVLAHHFWHADNLPKKREYLFRAGVAAQAAYANRAAIDYFERLAPLLEGSARIDVLLKLAKVLELVDWARAEAVAREALELARGQAQVVHAARAQTALAELARKHGRYDEARELLEQAAAAFAQANDRAGEGEVRHLEGTLAAQRGDYVAAVGHYEASLAIRRDLDDKAAMGALFSNLGVVAEYRNDLEASRRYHEQAMQLRREIGDRRGIGVSMTCIGMTAFLQKRHAEARDWFAQAAIASREVGDGWMVALSNHNLGNAARAMADYASARRHYAQSIAAFGAFQDRWAYAFLFEDIAVLAALERDATAALALLGAADALREASRTPRAPSLERELDEQVGPALNELCTDDRERHRGGGRALDFPRAVQRALLVCEARAAE